MKKMKNYTCNQLINESPWVTGRMKKLLWAIFVVGIIFLFLPWTQNVETQGKVTTLLPGQRPQEVQTIIGGRIEKWYVREGDFVRKGDTIVRISEVKADYLDPGLLNQTNIQISAKEASILNYSSKINAINKQITQLENNRNIKSNQAENKLQQSQFYLRSEEVEKDALKTQLNIAKTQLQRDSLLLTQGLKSPLDVENRRNKVQELTSKYIAAENKVLSARASVENAKYELRNINAEFGEKLAKAESDRFSTMSLQMETEADVSKLRNEYSNYSIRSGFYIITSPQDGYVTKTIASGLGENIKEGAPVCTIMPSSVNMAVEMYVSPVDMPLIQKGSTVRFVFDGWPTIVFSGWPRFTYGTFPAKVFAIDNVPSENGKYRVLAAADYKVKKWPEQLRVGTGARGYMLLKRVRLWYEIWRKLNGFPPDYYKAIENGDIQNKKSNTK